jgi:hypothetical protein
LAIFLFQCCFGLNGYLGRLEESRSRGGKYRPNIRQGSVLAAAVILDIANFFFLRFSFTTRIMGVIMIKFKLAPNLIGQSNEYYFSPGVL